MTQVPGTSPPQHFQPTKLDSFTASFLPSSVSQQMDALNAQLRKQPILTRNGVRQLLVFYMLSNPADTYSEVVNTVSRYNIVLPIRFERGLLPTGAVPFWRDKLARIQTESAVSVKMFSVSGDRSSVILKADIFPWDFFSMALEERADACSSNKVESRETGER